MDNNRDDIMAAISQLTQYFKTPNDKYDVCHTTEKWNFVNLTPKFMHLTKEVPNNPKAWQSW